MGGIVGAALVYANYFHAIDVYEGGPGIRTLETAGLFSTYAVRPNGPLKGILIRLIPFPQAPYMTNVSAFFSEFLATAILLICILAAVDPHNTGPPELSPLMLFMVVLGIGMCLGMETGVLSRITGPIHTSDGKLRLRYQSCARLRSPPADRDGWLWKGRIHIPKVSRPHLRSPTVI